jgi:hypothetical protein
MVHAAHAIAFTYAAARNRLYHHVLSFVNDHQSVPIADFSSLRLKEFAENASAIRDRFRQCWSYK